MNAFYSSHCPLESARNLCKVHLNSQFKESNQILSITLRIAGIDDERLCKLTHINHPTVKWVRESIHHYNWLVEHVLAIQDLVNKPTGHDSRLKAILEHLPDLPDNGFTPPPKVVDLKSFPELKHSVIFDTVTECYKKYLTTKYKHWQTRTDKRPMKVEFVGVVPDYLKDVF